MSAPERDEGRLDRFFMGVAVLIGCLAAAWALFWLGIGVLMAIARIPG